MASKKQPHDLEFEHTDDSCVLQVMTVVKRLVKSGITICATIHSPTPYGKTA